MSLTCIESVLDETKPIELNPAPLVSIVVGQKKSQGEPNDRFDLKQRPRNGNLLSITVVGEMRRYIESTSMSRRVCVFDIREKRMIILTGVEIDLSAVPLCQECCVCRSVWNELSNLS